MQSDSYTDRNQPRRIDLNVCFSVGVVEALRELATANDVNLSVVVRKAVAIGLKELTGTSVY